MSLNKQTTIASQKFVEIDKIKEDMVILKNGAVRAVLLASSINLALKSTEEQDATIYQFQNFLNSIDFPLQFVIQSRKLNIDNYLETIGEIEKKQDNELLKIQTREYIDFVRNFVELQNIMTKHFYISVPFTKEISKGATLTSATKMTDEQLLKVKDQLWQRVDEIVAGISRVGIKCTPLNTQELTELFYDLYNPEEEGKRDLSQIQMLIS
jgi:hypothetical protein